MNSATTKRILATTAGGLVALGLFASPASAKSGDVVRRGHCSGVSNWKLKAGARDSGLEIEFEVDSNRVGQTWAVQLSDNGTPIFSGQRSTQGPSGSFSVRKVTPNRAGSDTIVGTARNTANGETCQGVLTI
jgi:predicted RecA/RadA family phage recombinase